MTNGPFEVSKRAEKTSGALAVSFEGSSSFAGSTFVAALFADAPFVPALPFVAAPAVTATVITRIKATPVTIRFDTRIVLILLPLKISQTFYVRDRGVIRLARV